ncbi:MAG: hypothetical protein ACHQ1D_04260 [Nitrososphaerales archaeon]
MSASQSIIDLDPEEKQKRIEELMEHTKEEIATQWVTLGSDMKAKHDKLKLEFMWYKMANDISRFFEDVRSEKSDEILGSKIRQAIQGNILYIDWLKKEKAKSEKLASQK